MEGLCQPPWVGWCPRWVLGTAGAPERGGWDANPEDPWGPTHPWPPLPAAVCPQPTAGAGADPGAAFPPQAMGIYPTAQSSRVLSPLGVAGCLSPISSGVSLGPGMLPEALRAGTGRSWTGTGGSEGDGGLLEGDRGLSEGDGGLGGGRRALGGGRGLLEGDGWLSEGDGGLSEGDTAQTAFVPDTAATPCVSRSSRLSLLTTAVQTIGVASPPHNYTQHQTQSLEPFPGAAGAASPRRQPPRPG